MSRPECEELNSRLADLAEDDLLAALPPVERERLLEHAAACPACGESLRSYRALLAAMKELPRLRPPSDLCDRVLAEIAGAPGREAVLPPPVPPEGAAVFSPPGSALSPRGPEREPERAGPGARGAGEWRRFALRTAALLAIAVGIGFAIQHVQRQREEPPPIPEIASGRAPVPPIARPGGMEWEQDERLSRGTRTSESSAPALPEVAVDFEEAGATEALDSSGRGALEVRSIQVHFRPLEQAEIDGLVPLFLAYAASGNLARDETDTRAGERLIAFDLDEAKLIRFQEEIAAYAVPAAQGRPAEGDRTEEFLELKADAALDKAVKKAAAKAAAAPSTAASSPPGAGDGAVVSSTAGGPEVAVDPGRDLLKEAHKQNGAPASAPEATDGRRRVAPRALYAGGEGGAAAAPASADRAPPRPEAAAPPVKGRAAAGARQPAARIPGEAQAPAAPRAPVPVPEAAAAAAVELKRAKEEELTGAAAGFAGKSGGAGEGRFRREAVGPAAARPAPPAPAAGARLEAKLGLLQDEKLPAVPSPLEAAPFPPAPQGAGVGAAVPLRTARGGGTGGDKLGEPALERRIRIEIVLPLR